MDVVEAKDIVRVEIDRPTPTVLEVSHSIHAHPELNFEKHPAHDTLTGVLEEQGLAVERSAYDAPPGIGQACGHNIIGAASLGAELAVAKVARALGGRVGIPGTPT